MNVTMCVIWLGKLINVSENQFHGVNIVTGLCTIKLTIVHIMTCHIFHIQICRIKKVTMIVAIRHWNWHWYTLKLQGANINLISRELFCEVLWMWIMQNNFFLKSKHEGPPLNPTPNHTRRWGVSRISHQLAKM